jgi:hypothetical protein
MPKKSPELSIATEKVYFIVVKAREFMLRTWSRTLMTSSASDDSMISVLEDHGEDPVADELRGFIGALNEDEQTDLVALAWLGRGDGTIEDWSELRAEAARAHNKRTAAYVLGNAAPCRSPRGGSFAVQPVLRRFRDGPSIARAGRPSPPR